MAVRGGVWGVLLAVSVVVLGGCATGHAGAGWTGEEDAFQEVQEASGLERAWHHPVGEALTVEGARALLEHLTTAPAAARNHAPRRVLAWLLGEVLSAGEPVVYAEVRWRAERFDFLVWLRPDGTWVEALTGQALQHAGAPRLVAGEWRVGALRVGDFYFARGGVFYPVTEALRRADGPPVAELGLGRDPLNAALDGAQGAVEELVVGLAECIREPIRTVEGLARLPGTVARLVAGSPEYFARYGALPREEQIREAARLSTHVLMVVGSAEVTAGRLGGWGAELTLTARGELAWSMGVEARGAVVGTRALSVVHMATRGGGPPGAPRRPAASPGPGKWTYKKPTTESVQARDYQEQIAGRPSWYVYMVEDVEFDGFNGVALLEAKGASYKHFLTKRGEAQPWFEAGDGLRGLMEQAERQSRIAELLKRPVIWHVAEAEFAVFLRKTFREMGWDNITVRHTPPTR